MAQPLTWTLNLARGTIAFGNPLPFAGNTYVIAVAGGETGAAYTFYVMGDDGTECLAKSTVASNQTHIALDSEALHKAFLHEPHETRTFHAYCRVDDGTADGATVAEGDLPICWNPLWKDSETGETYSMRGPKGDPGLPGDKGDKGSPGQSAYQLAVQLGYQGNEAQWLESLKGRPGSATMAYCQADQQWHKFYVVKNIHDEYILTIDQQGLDDDPNAQDYVLRQGDQTIEDVKTFTSSPIVPNILHLVDDQYVPDLDDSSQKVPNTSWVQAMVAAVKSWVTGVSHTFTAKQTFAEADFYQAVIPGGKSFTCYGSAEFATISVTGDASLGGDLSLVGDLAIGGDITIEGALILNHAITFSQTETHTGDESHTGAVTIENLVSLAELWTDASRASTQGVNSKYVHDLVLAAHTAPSAGYQAFVGDFPDYHINGGTAFDNDPDTTNWRSFVWAWGAWSNTAKTIGVAAFQGAKSLVRICFEQVDEVKDRAFKYTHELFYAHLPLCKKIGAYAFWNNYGDARYAACIRRIHAPNVEEIGTYAFATSHCLCDINNTTDTDFTPSQSNPDTPDTFNNTVYFPKVVTIGDRAFYNCGTHYNNARYRLTKTDLPLCRYIGAYAFYHDEAYGGKYYTDVRIGHGKDGDGEWLVPLGEYPPYGTDTRNTIGAYAFYDNDNIARIEMPRMQVVGDYCFFGGANVCTYLDLSSVEEIGAYAFGYLAYSLPTGVTIDLDLPLCLVIGTHAFRCDNNNNPHIASLSAPNLETVGTYAFYRLTALAKINAPFLETIGDYAFAEDYALVGFEEDAETGDEVDTIDLSSAETLGAYAFRNCSNLEKLTLPSLGHVNVGAFSGLNKCHFHVPHLTGAQLLALPYSEGATAAAFPWGAGGTSRFHCSDMILNTSGQPVSE